MSLKFKILFPLIFIGLLVLTKYILWDFDVSTGKRVGNLTKISKKGKIFKTWEGTIDEGSGDQLTSYFSVEDEALAQEMYEYKGKQIVIYYEQHILGFPRETNYVVTAWEPGDDIVKAVKSLENNGNSASRLLSQTLFCSLLGSLINNDKLYNDVKAHVKEHNLYLFNQIQKCNE